MQDVTDVGTRRLNELLGSFDLVQHVNGPTQRHGNTLDRVITPSHFVPAGVDVELTGMLSDHALIVSRLPLAVEPAVIAERLVHGWRRVDRSELRRILEDGAVTAAVR